MISSCPEGCFSAFSYPPGAALSSTSTRLFFVVQKYYTAWVFEVKAFLTRSTSYRSKTHSKKCCRFLCGCRAPEEAATVFLVSISSRVGRRIVASALRLGDPGRRSSNRFFIQAPHIIHGRANQSIPAASKPTQPATTICTSFPANCDVASWKHSETACCLI